jgi:hypothetical protein
VGDDFEDSTYKLSCEKRATNPEARRHSLISYETTASIKASFDRLRPQAEMIIVDYDNALMMLPAVERTGIGGDMSETEVRLGMNLFLVL